MAHDLTSIPLDQESLAAASAIIECFYAKGSDLSSSKLMELEGVYGITFADAADALGAHRLYIAEHETTD